MRLITLLLCAFALIWTRAQPVAADGLTIEGDTFPLSPHLEFLVDDSAKLTIETIPQQPSSNWFKVKDETPSFGFMEQVLWARATLINSTPEQKRFLLEIAFPPLDNVQLFQLNRNDLLYQATVGDTLAFSARPFDHRNFLLPITLQPEAQDTIYIRVQTGGALQLPVTLWEPIHFFLHDQYALIINSLFFGIIFVMAFYNLLLFIRVRDTVYLYYIGYVSTFYIYQLIGTGLGFQLLWPNALLWNNYCSAIILPLNIVFVALFFVRVYAVQNTHPKTHRLILVIALLALTCMLLPFFISYHVAIISSVALVACGGALALWVCYYLWYQNPSRTNMYLALAFSVFLAGAVVLALSKLGFLPRSPLTEYAARIGACIEAILLSYALAERLHEARIAAENRTQKANEKMLNLAHQHAATLEEKVALRTRELEQALQQVHSLNNSLKDLSLTDQLTGSRNRRFMDEYLAREIKSARRNKQCLSIMLIDLDHFKQVNDTYGHAVGDLCLKVVSDTIANNLRQPPDEVCRYGGEELVVILPNTARSDAKQVAEKLRVCIESLNIQSEEQLVHVTASFGVSCFEPSTELSPTQLLQEADRALYQAKHSGRNRVVFAEREN
ncbi:sensor domain-containing diguanylate cyclase [Ketobacter sp.]